ncbi:hypothetical protein CYMTET_56267 [Cymbomonas tetramitiformis]|uniref:Uncharacterized protein n=1 Tax=Cymbomonas tetramitiformis TaxID=36881 RepID=A0AAE0EM03_9CHLO|nr:hypothetical protein CYMTET_56267 [Cymbomonas tetramitiformis]
MFSKEIGEAYGVDLTARTPSEHEWRLIAHKVESVPADADWVYAAVIQGSSGVGIVLLSYSVKKNADLGNRSSPAVDNLFAFEDSVLMSCRIENLHVELSGDTICDQSGVLPHGIQYYQFLSPSHDSIRLK